VRTAEIEMTTSPTWWGCRNDFLLCLTTQHLIYAA
jgi:hypothetical protein